MVKELDYKLAATAGKEHMMFMVMRQQGYTKATIMEYAAGGVVNVTLDTIKRMIVLEECVDYCQLLMIHDDVSYVALAKVLFQKMNAQYVISIYGEMEIALFNAVRLCTDQQPSNQTVLQLFSIFRACQYFGPYTDLIALMVAYVYAVHEGVGYISDYSAETGIVISKV